MAELGHVRDHQGVEEPTLRCGSGGTGGGVKVPPGGSGGPRGLREGPLGRESGRIARPGPGVACFPGRGGGTRRQGRGGQCLGALGPAHRPQPLALPPEESATAAAPAPTQTEAQVTAKPDGNGPTLCRPSLGPQMASTGVRDRHCTQNTGHDTDEQEPSGPGHRTPDATRQAVTPVNRSQVAQDTAHTRQHTERAHW